jgi:hypothetical protein
MTVKSGSTTEVGDALRDAVASLLRTKYTDVRTEVLIGHKKVDVVYTYVEYGRQRTVGVECKNYARPLTKDDFSSEIWADYGPLVDRHLLDLVIVVAPKDINAMARAYVEGVAALRFQTYAQFEDSLIGLNDYVAELAGMFQASDLESYYVDARFDGHDQPALDVIGDWLRSENAQPLAILGGYGKGKTSLALRIVSQQASRHRADPSERIPVLIRLGQVVHETQLEALFGKEFTARYPATDFRFSTLMHLNTEGRLLVVLDGFDEMKHAMSIADFRATFREFNRLLGPRARVLLLGRPNALPTEARTHVLRGLKRVGLQMAKDPNFAEWREEEIAFFDAAEIDLFLRGYLTHLLRNQVQVGGVSVNAFVDQRVREVSAKVSLDLLRRPVQARIVAELAYDPAFVLDGFTSYTLYEQFIRQLIERDTEEKRARGAIPFEPRYRFQQELAWWSWTRAGDGQGFFNRDDIPQTLVDALPEGDATDGATKLSEYIVSSLTEEKEAGVLYFAHRSFQEFLVADRLRTVRLTPDQHVAMSSAITPDIRAFLDAAPDQSHLASWFETLSACRGPLDIDYLRYFQSDAALVKEIAVSARTPECSPAHVAIIGLAHHDTANWPLSRSDVINILAGAVMQFDSETPALAGLCLLRMAHGGDNAAMKAFVAALMVRVARRVRDPDDIHNALTIAPDKLGALEETLAICLRKRRNVEDGTIVDVDTEQACRLLYVHVSHTYIRSTTEPELAIPLSPFIGPVGPAPQFVTAWSMPALRIEEMVKNKQHRDLVERIIRTPGEKFKIVAVHDRTKRSTALMKGGDFPLSLGDDDK